MANINFGTDGFRSIIAKGFTFDNVEKISIAIAHFILEDYGINTPVIIGFDPRFLGREFSEHSAKILAGYGFDVFVSNKVLPTPALAFNAKKLNACAIMFTASHNPYQYQGLKFIPPYGGPANSDITDRLTALLEKPFEHKHESKSYSDKDFKSAYFEQIEKLIDFNAIKEYQDASGIKVLYDALHSAGSLYFTELLSSHKIAYEPKNLNHCFDFGNIEPDPNRENLASLVDWVSEMKNAVGFSNDGDADRFGVINERGEFVTPNEVLAILLLHLVKHKNYCGSYVKTIAGSSMHDLLAKKLALEIFEVPVGFKHVAQAMMEHDIIIGGEESGGLSIKGHIPEKDGILANLLILEAMAYSKKSLCELQEDLKSFIGCDFFNKRIDIELESFELVEKVIGKFKCEVEKVADFSVKNKDFRDGVKLKLDDDLSWVLVRKSGTEPLLRIYFESTSIKNLEAIEVSLRTLI